LKGLDDLERLFQRGHDVDEAFPITKELTCACGELPGCQFRRRRFPSLGSFTLGCKRLDLGRIKAPDSLAILPWVQFLPFVEPDGADRLAEPAGQDGSRQCFPIVSHGRGSTRSAISRPALRRVQLFLGVLLHDHDP
jgi:hypothetical protein